MTAGQWSEYGDKYGYIPYEKIVSIIWENRTLKTKS